MNATIPEPITETMNATIPEPITETMNATIPEPITETMNAPMPGRISPFEIETNPSDKQGGYTRKNKRKNNKTRKIKGGVWLYATRIYRVLNMHLDTSNIYNYGTKTSVWGAASVLGTYNKLANTATKEQVPVYVVKEQIRFLLLAYSYLKTKDTNKFNKILSSDYDGLTTFILDQDYGVELNKFKDMLTKITALDSSIVEEKYKTFIKSDSTIHSDIYMLLENTNKLVSYVGGDISRSIKQIFTHASNCMFYKYTQNLFIDPRTIYGDIKLNEYYKAKGLLGEFSFKKKEPYKNDTLEFLDKFTFCLIMTPHFTCSQASSFALSGILNAATGSTAIISGMVNATLAKHNGVISNFLKIPLFGLNIGTQAVTSLINTPNCYMSMTLMMYVLLFSIKPLMPQEGMAYRTPAISKSNRLNSIMYKPVTKILNTIGYTKKQQGGRKNKKTRKC